MKGKISLKILPVVASLLLGACASKECYDNQNTLPLADLLDMQTHRTVTLDSLTVYGIGAPADSLLADTASQLSQIYLPFRNDATSTAFAFRYEATAAPQPDTITFHYRAKPWFTSEACGVVYFYHIDSIGYTRHLIDSVAVPGMLITNAMRSNIEIYFKPLKDSQR